MTDRRARIACLDLDTFFVSVERLLDPSLIGKPVVVGAAPGHRGVVTSASYEVRALGVRSGMSITEARKLAPDAVYVPTRHDTYGPYAQRVKAVVERWCPVVITASIDEFFLDFHGCEGLYRARGDAPGRAGDDAAILRAVRAMRQAIQDEVGLPASVGIGTTRPIAKMTSGRAKPAGVFPVWAGEERAFLDPLPVRKFPGFGPRAEERLVAAGFPTLGALLSVPEGPRREAVRGMIEAVTEAADGGGALPARDRPAFREHDVPGLVEGSISNEHTFFADVHDRQRAEDELRALVERVAWRARRRSAMARTLTLKVRYADFETFTRARTFAATDDERRLLAVAVELLRSNWEAGKRIRLLGVGLSHLTPGERQLKLPFGEVAGRGGVARAAPAVAIDAVREKFGYGAIRMGGVGR